MEALGLDGLFVGDHLAAALPLLDSTITLATVAAVTERIRIGFGVMVLALRHPAWAPTTSSSGIVGDDWLRQCELIAQARALLD